MSSKRYIKLEPNLEDYKCDQTIIIDRRYLKYINGLNYVDPEDEIRVCRKRYPYTNSYYHHTEYVDAYKRVSHTLDCKYFLEASSTDLMGEKLKHERDPYSEREAHIRYLSTNPISFLILSKPGIGENHLGKLLADYWNCVYIDPEVLILEEIESGSRAGKCIDYNLRSGRAVGVDIILKLVEKRVRSKTAQHRGYVICGFPLIPNDLYEEDPVSSESALFNVRDIFEDIVEEVVKFVMPVAADMVKSVKFKHKEEDYDDDIDVEVLSENTVVMPPKLDSPKDYGSLLGSICAAPVLEKNYEEQLDFIFNLFVFPFQIIYVRCDNADVISRRSEYRFDVHNNVIVSMQEDQMEQLFLNNTYLENRENIFVDIAASVKNQLPRFLNAFTEYLVKLPKDFPANVAVQLDRFYIAAMPIIECYILAHNPEYFMKVNGCLTPAAMFNVIKTRIEIMPLQKVLVPKKILERDLFDAEDRPPPVEDEYKNLTPEDVFDDFKNKHTIGPIFKWCWSDWGSKCPVSMKEGDSVDGFPEFAVHFLNKLFFLSSENAVVKFIRNPRPYLLPPYPKPSCRIFVMGPRCSGKTAVATCLAYLLNGVVISPDQLTNDFKEKKRQEHRDRIKASAFNDGIKLLDQQRQREFEEAEIARQEDIEEWYELAEPMIAGFVEYYDILPKESEESTEEIDYKNISSFAVKVTKSSDTRRQQEVDRIKGKILEYEENLKQMNLPTDPAECQRLVENKELIRNYLPESLATPTKPPLPATVLDPFVIEYANNILEQSEIVDFEMSDKEAYEIYADAIKTIEDKNEALGNSRGGWIIDGLPLNVSLLEMFSRANMADDVFLLRDDPSHTFLIQRFETRGANHFRHFRDFFQSLGKTDAAWRSPSTKSTDSYKARIAHYILDEILDRVQVFGEQEGEFDEKVKQEYFKKHPRRSEASAYEKHLNEFEHQVPPILDFFENLKIPLYTLSVTNKSLEFLLLDAIKNIEDRFRVQAKVMTQNDREEELNDIMGPEVDADNVEEEEEEEEKTEVGKEENLFFLNRRFGDTLWFCPVVFKNYFVMWQGKEEFTVKFSNKVYLLSSEEAMKKFVDNPRKYLILRHPPNKFPPPRICIVGPSASGKTILSNALAKNYGLFNVSYLDILRHAQSRIYYGEGEGEEEEKQREEENAMPTFQREILDKLKQLWFKEPYKSFGFVIDGYPMEPSDVVKIFNNFFIPDVILNLTVTDQEVHNRLIEVRVEEWRKERFDSVRRQNAEIIQMWENKRERRINDLMAERKENRYIEKLKEIDKRLEKEEEAEIEEETSVLRTKSQISYKSVEEQEDLDIVLRIVAEEISDPLLLEEPQETIEEIIDIVANDIDRTYRNQMQLIELTKELLENESVVWIDIDANLTPDKVFAQAVRVTDKIKLRNESVFERTYDIDPELAEKLLSQGYYLSSRFGRSCPVQLYDSSNSIQMYLPLKSNYEIYPIVHREYIYFITGKRNRDLFIKNPLKYVNKTDIRFPLIPFKVGVIGPFKSGKTTLAKRFKRDLGLSFISRGKAIRYVLQYLPHTKLFKDVEENLRKGENVPDELVMKCVFEMSLNSQNATQGVVLDGFPERIEEVFEMSKYQLLPHVAFEMNCEEEQLFEFLDDSSPPPGVMPVNYSHKFMKYRYELWETNQKIFRPWLFREYQIVAQLQINKNKWGIWNDALEIAMSVLYEVKSYYKNVGFDMVLHLSNMQVSPLEFLERSRKRYSSYCPCCLHYDDALVSGGDPPDRTGLVQYKEYFYWLCLNHMHEFKSDPNKFLPPYNSKIIPDDLPYFLHLTEKPDNCHEGGICIVCYWDNLPKKVLIEGILDYCVEYRDKIYLFDSGICMKKFMKYPLDYFRKVVVPSNQSAVSLAAKSLPIIGYLEQFTASQVINALKVVGRLRPVIPGLSISASAAILIGLYLKVHNPETPDNFRMKYAEGLETCYKRRSDFIKFLESMKNRHNPHLYYEEPIPKFVDPILDKPLHPAIGPKIVEPEPIVAEEELVEKDFKSYTSSAVRIIDYILNSIDYGAGARRVPVPDDRFDYLCNYYKPLSKVPAFLNVVDIAGLVKGASEGQGLGNAFLSHISACDAIFHLCRAFEDDEVTHIEGDVNPVRDLDIISEELRLKDEDMLMKNLEKLERTVVRGGDKKGKAEFDCLMKIKGILVDEKKHIRFSDWHTTEIDILNKYLFLTTKPALYLVNLSEKDYIRKKNKWLIKIKEWVDKNDPGATIIPFSGAFEQKLIEMEPAERQKYLEDHNCTSALDKIIVQGYKALQLEYFFTAGPDEVKAWTIQKGTKAPQAAGKIHTDFEKGFIMAEVMKFNDFKEEGSESAVKSAGKYRQQGRNYVVEDGDIIFFKFNAGAGLKDAKKK